MDNFSIHFLHSDKMITLFLSDQQSPKRALSHWASTVKTAVTFAPELFVLCVCFLCFTLMCRMEKEAKKMPKIVPIHKK